jgi:hypothetical protein
VHRDPASQAMTARYTGEVPLEQVRAAFSMQNSKKVVILENSGKWKKAAASASNRLVVYNQPARANLGGRSSMAE